MSAAINSAVKKKWGIIKAARERERPTIINDPLWQFAPFCELQSWVIKPPRVGGWGGEG